MNRTKRTLNRRHGFSAGGLQVTLVALVVLVCVWAAFTFPQGSSQQVPTEPTAPLSPWQKIEPHLDRLDRATAETAENRLQQIRTFFREKKRGAKDFAEWSLGWTAKFYLAKGKLLADDGNGLREFLKEKFEEHIFKGEDLQAVLEAAMAGVLTDTQGLENATLCQIRRDIAQDELCQAKLPELQSDQAFQEEYRRLKEEILPKLFNDLGIGLASQITNLALSEVPARAIGPGLAARLGFSGSGLLGSLGRFGGVIAVGVAAVWAIDKVIDWLLNLFGYGPAAELAGNVERALDRLESQFIDGDPAFVASYQQLRQQERDAPTPEGQQQFRDQADRIEKSGGLGLRRELQKLQELQSKLRRTALQKLVTAEGGQ